MPASKELKTDLAAHAALFALQAGVVSMQGLNHAGATPPLIYPCLLILAAINAFRLRERMADYGTRLVFVPMGLIALLCAFCLINEIGAVFWAFYIPRWHYTLARVAWYQSVLLLSHPLVYPIVVASIRGAFAHLKRRGYFGGKLAVTLLAAGTLLWLIRSQNLSPDGYDWLKHSVYPGNWSRYLREPMGTYLFHLWVWAGMDWFHLAPYVSITLLTIVCGMASTWLLIRVLRGLFPPEWRGWMLALFLTTFGYIQIFAGNIEIYALLFTALMAFLRAAQRYWDGKGSAAAAGALFGVLFCVHLSAGWWLPAFLALPFVKRSGIRGQGPAWRDFAAMTTWFAAVTAAFWTFVLARGYGWDFGAMWAHFWSDQVMLVGTDAAMFRPLGDYATFDYYMTMINEYFYMMPGGCVLLAALAAGYRRPARPDAAGWWFLSMTALYLAYSLTWRPDRHFPADWDLFSGLTVPALFSLGLLLAKLRAPRAAAEYILYQCAVFNGAFLLLQLLRNHWKVTDWPLMI